jgi:peroxiredoxin
MKELVKLEENYKEFEKRKVRIVAASLDGPDDSKLTQDKLPHLVILSDADRELANAAKVIGPHHAPDGADTVSPTTVLIDRRGKVRWVFRPTRYIERLSPDQLAAAVDEHLGS